MGCSNSSPKGEIHHNTRIHSETGNYSNTKANLTHKEVRAKKKKKQIDPTPNRRIELIKIRAELKEIETRRTLEQINGTRSWFFERINKIDKPLANLIKKKRENIQINKIMNEKGEVTTNTKEIKRILKTYYDQPYTNKLGNLEEMDAFLESQKLPELEQEEIQNLNRPKTR